MYERVIKDLHYETYLKIFSKLIIIIVRTGPRNFKESVNKHGSDAGRKDLENLLKVNNKCNSIINSVWSIWMTYSLVQRLLTESHVS